MCSLKSYDIVILNLPMVLLWGISIGVYGLLVWNNGTDASVSVVVACSFSVLCSPFFLEFGKVLSLERDLQRCVDDDTSFHHVW